MMRLVCFLLAVAATANLATSQPPFPDGANCLLIGMSFFIPGSRVFDDIAALNGFPNHSYQDVFGGGKQGSPSSLWDNKRSEIEEMLATGDIDLFGLTYYNPQTSTYGDYVKWIDLALSYNPNTTILIAAPWSVGGAATPSLFYDLATNVVARVVYQVVRQLRANYPDTDIHFVSHGKVGPVMKRKFERGELEEITENLGRGDDALFSDVLPGHGGRMMLDMVGLVFIYFLYSGDSTRELDLPFEWNPSEMQDIVQGVVEYNDRFEF